MEESLDQLSLLMRNNLLNETGDIQRELTGNISELRDTVEEAAEKIIGSDEDAMRFAAAQLDELREEVEREMELALNEGQGQQPGRQREQQGDEQNPPGQGQRRQDGENQQQRGQGQAREEQQSQPGQGQGQSNEEQEEDQQRQGRGQAGEEQQSQPGQGQGRRPGDQENPQPAQGRDGQPRGPNDQPNRRPDGNRDIGGSSGGSDLFRNLDELDFDGPLTGLDFRDWEDRLREVEEVIEIPELRNQVSEVRQSARDIRRENKENGKPPKWDLVEMQILRPMTEINKRLEEELSLRQPKRELIPVDHEPVPAQYSELVRRYYERLGGRKEKNDTRN
jgi:hypothetical protein